MRPRVTLVAAGAGENSAVNSRIGGFIRGFVQRGWDIIIIDPASSSVTVADRLLSHLPAALRSMLERAGIEGDVRPAAGWRTRHGLRAVATDVMVVSVPPFSLLGAAAVTRDPRVPLVVDYRDPWSARHHPPPLARATRTIERYTLRRAAAVIYAGGPVLGDLLIQHLRLAPDTVMSVPNGFEPADTANLRAVPVRPERNGTPLDLVMSGYWYGRNGPGILLDALKCVGSAVAGLTVIGGISPPIAGRLRRATGHPLAPAPARSRRALYERLHHADAAVVTMNTASAVESRIPAKVYDYLATGVPVIAVCPPGAALLQIPEARHFHHIHHRDTTGLAALLRRAMQDRATLCQTSLTSSSRGAAPTATRPIAALGSSQAAAVTRS
ncbi:MAG: glycosyltransferase [Pseudonocardiaceae bacterium]